MRAQSRSGRRRPRSFDQPHALNLDLDYRIGEHWRLNLAWRYHTGWPTTPLSLQEVLEAEGDLGGDEDADESEDGAEEAPELELVPVLGPLNSERLADYHRLDLRASRSFRVPKGELTLFVEVQNVYDRKNESGFDHEVDDEEGTLVRIQERWPGIFPSIGVSWRF